MKCLIIEARRLEYHAHINAYTDVGKYFWSKYISIKKELNLSYNYMLKDLW